MSTLIARDRQASERVCLSCGADIDAQISRVLGDRNGNVPVCKRCGTNADGHEFESTTYAVRSYRASRGADVLTLEGQP